MGLLCFTLSFLSCIKVDEKDLESKSLRLGDFFSSVLSGVALSVGSIALTPSLNGIVVHVHMTN